MTMNLQPKTNSQLGFISLLGVVVVVALIGVVSLGVYQVVSGKDSITWLSARFQNDIETRLPRLADGVEQLKRDLVLGEDDRVWTLTIAVPSQFKEDITAEKSLYIDGDLDVAGVLRASNLISAILGGAGISVTGDSAVTVINTDPGSAQSIFKTIKVTGGTDIKSSNNEDTLTFEAGDNISLSSDSDNNKITISAEGQDVDYTKSGWKQLDDFLYLTDSGDNVGIGTETPSSKFHVVGNSTFSGIMNLSGVTTPLVIASNSNNTAGLKFVNLTSSSPVGVGGGKVLSVDSAGNVILVTDESGAADLSDVLPPGAQVGATLYFDGTTWGHTTNLYHDGGKVGISTVTPEGRLHVFTNDASTVGLTIQGDALQSANLLEWKDSDGNLLSFIDENGVYNGTFVGDLQGNVTGNVTPTGFTAGSIAFAGTGGVLSQDNSNLFWDDTNNRLGIGTNSPQSTLDVSGTLRLTNNSRSLHLQ